TAELFDSVDGVVGNGDDRSLGLVVTDASGNYSFARPPEDVTSYYLSFRLPGGYVFTAASAGTDLNDSDADPQTGQTPLFAAINAVQTFDAGARLTAPPSGFAQALGGSADARTVTRDAAGNVYVAGTFRGTLDLDPGLGVYPLQSAGGADVFVACYTSVGTLL